MWGFCFFYFSDYLVLLLRFVLFFFIEFLFFVFLGVDFIFGVVDFLLFG